MGNAVWYIDDIERLAQGLILTSIDPQWRAGITALAYQLGAKNLVAPPGVTWTTPAHTQNSGDRRLADGTRWDGR